MDKAQNTDLYYLMRASLSRNSYPGLPQHCSLWSSVVRKGRYLRFSICHFLSSFKEISVETCNTFNRVWKDELNSFGWKMVLVAQMNSLLNSWGKRRSRTQLLLTDFSDSTTQKLMKYVTLCLHCPHLFLLATKSHWSFETGASLKSLTYASHIFSHQKGLGAPGLASKALLRSPGSQDQYLDAQVLDVALLALAHWTAWCVLLLLFSSSLPVWEDKAPCTTQAPRRTKHLHPPKVLLPLLKPHSLQWGVSLAPRNMGSLQSSAQLWQLRRFMECFTGPTTALAGLETWPRAWYHPSEDAVQ